MSQESRADLFSKNFQHIAERFGFSVEMTIFPDDYLLHVHSDLSPKTFEADELTAKAQKFTLAITDAANLSGLTLDLSRSEDKGTLRFDIIGHYDENLDEKTNSDKVDFFNQHFEKLLLNDLRQRRPKRKKDELPFPDKPASHVDNRRGYIEQSTLQYSARIDPEVIKLEAEFRKSTGLSKREITEQALKMFIASYDK